MEKKLNNITLKEVFIISLILILFINLVRSWDKLNGRIQYIKDSRLKLAEEEKKREKLKRELVRIQSNYYIEKQAREKLNLNKDGELVILLPTPVLQQTPTPTPFDSVSNPIKWVRLFL